MKNKILLGVVVFLGIVLIVVIENKPNHSFFSQEKTITIKNENDKLQELNLEDYLIGVLAAEMPALFDIEALKAQAVAARSYAVYKIEHTKNDYDILTSITNQSYITKEEMQEKWQEEYQKYYDKISLAVHNTENEVMYYNNEIIEAFYFSMSNGKTEEASTVFKENLPYIESVESNWEKQDKNFEVTKQFSKTEFCQLLNIENCSELTISNIEKSDSGRVLNLKINDKEFLGTDIRKKLNLRSTDFQIVEKENTLIITTKGYGHGVGMSQYGANGMAKEGYNYKEILNYYYKDITIKKMV